MLSTPVNSKLPSARKLPPVTHENLRYADHHNTKKTNYQNDPSSTDFSLNKHNWAQLPSNVNEQSVYSTKNNEKSGNKINRKKGGRRH